MAPATGLRDRAAAMLRQLRRRAFTVLVLLPTILAACYYLLIAAPQYVSEARFIVRGRQAAPASMIGMAMGQAGFRTAMDEAMGIRDFIQSHSAVRAVRERLDLVAMFRRPEADLIARLWFAEPSAERLLDYFNRMVQADYDISSGIIRLQVHSFRPDDSQVLAQELMSLSETLVNQMNRHVQQDSLAVAEREVERAEARVTAAQAAILAFRERERAIDPGRNAGMVMDNVARLDASLAQAQAELQEAQRFTLGQDPRIVTLRNRIEGLRGQIQAEIGKLAGTEAGMTAQLREYERLMLEQEFARTQFNAANALLERARADLMQQQIFLLRVVEPNLAEYARYPKRLLNTAYIFLCLAVAYALAWLLIAGMREHAA